MYGVGSRVIKVKKVKLEKTVLLLISLVVYQVRANYLRLAIQETVILLMEIYMYGVLPLISGKTVDR